MGPREASPPFTRRAVVIKKERYGDKDQGSDVGSD